MFFVFLCVKKSKKSHRNKTMAIFFDWFESFSETPKPAAREPLLETCRPRTAARNLPPENLLAENLLAETRPLDSGALQLLDLADISLDALSLDATAVLVLDAFVGLECFGVVAHSLV